MEVSAVKVVVATNGVPAVAFMEKKARSNDRAIDWIDRSCPERFLVREAAQWPSVRGMEVVVVCRSMPGADSR